MVYNFNLGIGWASSGVEYAQSYRAHVFRKCNIPSKFIFMDMFPNDNLEHMTANLNFEDDQIIWLYTAFTDIKTAPTTFTLADLEKTFSDTHFTYERTGKTAKYLFENNIQYTVFFVNSSDDLVHCVEIVSNGFLIRKDVYTYCKVFSEYYAPYADAAHLYGRRFFNEDGTCAYEEVIDGDRDFFKFPDRVLYSKQELIGYLVQRLCLTKEDTVIIDRSTGISQAVFQNCGEAKVGMVIHADHFSEGGCDENNILWNNYYEYAFAQSERVDFYITATDAQNKLIRQQFVKLGKKEPNIVTIPVGSIDSLRKVNYRKRKKHSLITASRLAREKHCDWLAEAVVLAHDKIPDISLDIYGYGPERGKISEVIERNHAQSYIELMGQQKLDEVYVNYEAYFSASQSEGFGLTLLEAIGSGLPIIGFDVRYGNQTFIDQGKNGYKIAIHDDMDKDEKVRLLADHLIKLFTEDDINAFRRRSYKKAEAYLTEEVEKKWCRLLIYQN